jgi:hypothetical protein
MHHEFCPLCREPTDVGSHWDCVFTLLADWVAHRPPVGEVNLDPAPAPEKEKDHGEEISS